MSTTEAESKTFINGEPVEGDDQVDETPNAADSQLDDLEIQVESRDWNFSGDITIVNQRTGLTEEMAFARTYTQKPLSYTAMLQFTGLLGDRVSRAMTAGVTLDSILGDASSIASAVRDGDISNIATQEGFRGIDAFVEGLAKLAVYIPDIVEDCQCIWLRIPLHERPIVKEIWGRAPEDGGLSMQDGEEMLTLFIAQNYQDLADFFSVRLRRVLEAATKIRKKKQIRAGDLPQ